MSFFRIYPSIDFTILKTLALFGVYLVTRILLFGFAANLILRAVWLAYLGINFSFPDGLNYNRLTTNLESRAQLKNSPNILSRLITLEKLCNLSYSLAVLLAIFAASIFISMMSITWFLSMLGFTNLVEEPAFSYSLSFLIGIIQFGWLDRLIFTKKSKRTSVNKFKQGLSKLLGIITLSFLFRRELLVIRSNTNKVILSLFIILVLGTATVASAIQIGKYWSYGTLKMVVLDDKEFYNVKFSPRMSHASYESKFTEKKVAFRGCIQDEIIDGRFLKLFLVSWMQFDDFLEKKFKEVNYPFEVDRKLSREDQIIKIDSAHIKFSEVVDQLFNIEIADSLYKDLTWKRHKHPITNEEGYVTFVDINELPPDSYNINIYVNYYEKEDSLVQGRWVQIPFWRE